MFNTNTATKIDRVLSALNLGQELTAKQIRSRFGYTTTNSVRAVIAKLRIEGFPIYTNKVRNSKGTVNSKYRLGRAPRMVVAAGYDAMRRAGINPLV
jgi:hypothetical protein